MQLHTFFALYIVFLGVVVFGSNPGYKKHDENRIAPQRLMQEAKSVFADFGTALREVKPEARQFGKRVASMFRKSSTRSATAPEDFANDLNNLVESLKRNFSPISTRVKGLSRRAVFEMRASRAGNIFQRIQDMIAMIFTEIMGTVQGSLEQIEWDVESIVKMIFDNLKNMFNIPGNVVGGLGGIKNEVDAAGYE